jgi:3-dehydroquinate synthase
MQQLIYRCADLHVQHIAQSGDPFEFGSSRPLDYGHWSAHKLEQLTKYKLRHGEAVAIGIALDTTYSYLAGFLPEDEWQRVIGLLAAIGFALYVPQLSEHLAQPNDPRCILHGLAEFREHLGGELTIMLLEAVGRSFEVHNVDFEIVKRSIRLIENLSQGGHTPKVASSSEPQICLNGGRYGLPVQYVPTKPAAVSR